MGWGGVVLAILIPWLSGIVWMRLFLGAGRAAVWPISLGYGYFLAAFVSVVLLRLLSPLGLPVAFWSSMMALGLLALLGVRRLWRGWPVGFGALPRPKALSWQGFVYIGLLAWLLARFGALALEIWWEPLTPWDAWTTWALRAKAWSEIGWLAPFVSPADWLQDPSGHSYTIAAWRYPDTISLLALWPTLGYGSWSETAANLPWLGCILALGLGFYGQARAWGAEPLPSLVATWTLLSLPLLDTQVALAGYADIWMASVFGLGAIALFQWVRSGDSRQAILALGFALFSPLLKAEGLVWAILLVPALLAATLSARSAALLAVAATIGPVLVVAAGGLALTLPWIGSIELSSSQIKISMLGQFELGFHDSWAPTANSLLVYGNWHLLGYLLFPAIAVGMFTLAKNLGKRWLWAQLALVLGSVIALFFLFFMTDAYRWAEQGTSIGRLLLHFMPVYVFYFLCLWLAWGQVGAERETADSRQTSVVHSG
ncbi:hypothetical protein G3480_02710 [Thiorhodococcus mannitoliphagus]|uniref:Glycosyltransferase RgtA/B/C/D-like domain-containing protein n=1 Tax=Thiorhodococcus mannitoliphagus TaxID=329406 RepID=A0A6P1DT80_9GAMM|nr:hypothetical protein [Thiorhodococcus mannitoliphagus]NEX19232.1 hypothetical protein [Thiorhodococcus mannitoliphagus]